MTYGVRYIGALNFLFVLNMRHTRGPQADLRGSLEEDEPLIFSKERLVEAARGT